MCIIISFEVEGGMVAIICWYRCSSVTDRLVCSSLNCSSVGTATIVSGVNTGKLLVLLSLCVDVPAVNCFVIVLDDLLLSVATVLRLPDDTRRLALFLSPLTVSFFFFFLLHFKLLQHMGVTQSGGN